MTDCPKTTYGHHVLINKHSGNYKCGYCGEAFALVPVVFLTTVASKSTAIITRLDDINKGSDKACNIARELKKEAFDLLKGSQS